MHGVIINAMLVVRVQKSHLCANITANMSVKIKSHLRTFIAGKESNLDFVGYRLK